MTLSIPRLYEKKATALETLRPWAGRQVTGSNVFELVSDIASFLSKKTDRDTLYRSLLSLLNQTLTEKSLDLLIHRLLGNQDMLERLQEVYPWDGQPHPVSVVAEILSVRLVPVERKPLAHLVEFQLHSGPPAGLCAQRKMSRRYCSVVAVDIGFSKYPDGPYVFEHPRQLVGCRCQAIVDSVPDREGRPSIVRVEATSGQRTWNRRLANLRLAKNDFDAQYPCPYKLKHPCFECPVGYLPGDTEDPQCDLAVHPQSFRRDYCRHCGQTAFFDPLESLTQCSKCYLKAMRSNS